LAINPCSSAASDADDTPERSRDHAGGGVEDKVDRLRKVQSLHRAANLKAQPLLVRFANPLAAIRRDHQRIQNEQIGFDLVQRAHRRGELLEDAREIRSVDARCAIADRVHPEHAVSLGEQAHEMRLGKRIAGPVMAEAKQVATVKFVGGKESRGICHIG
jgi:hypothetical protein